MRHYTPEWQACILALNYYSTPCEKAFIEAPGCLASIPRPYELFEAIVTMSQTAL